MGLIVEVPHLSFACEDGTQVLKDINLDWKKAAQLPCCVRTDRVRQRSFTT
jgi:hypothetical protein